MKFGLNNEIYNKIKEIVKNNNKYKFKIFGSRARGNFSKISDIDIAVYKNVKNDDKYKIMNEFDLLDIIYKIDLVFITDNTKQELLEDIEKDGVEIK